MALLTVRNLTVEFRRPDGSLRAADGVSFELEPGERLAVVGESGSGKSVTCLSIMGLIRPPGRVVAGQVLFQGEDLRQASPARLRRIRGARLAMIFQDPLSSLNPTIPVGRQIATVMQWHRTVGSRAEAERRAVKLMGEVGIGDPERRARQYPFEFSGGMAQRAMIAMAVACQPAVLIADEPTSALDVTVQAQVLDMLVNLCQQLGMALLLVTHDLGVVASTCTRVLVMYAGNLLEAGETRQVLNEAVHPYTAGLLAAVPQVEAAGADLVPIPGEIPSLVNLPPECHFHPRCQLATTRCHTEQPPLTPRSAGHLAACWER